MKLIKCAVLSIAVLNDSVEAAKVTVGHSLKAVIPVTCPDKDCKDMMDAAEKTCPQELTAEQQAEADKIKESDAGKKSCVLICKQCDDALLSAAEKTECEKPAEESTYEAKSSDPELKAAEEKYIAKVKECAEANKAAAESHCGCGSSNSR